MESSEELVNVQIPSTAPHLWGKSRKSTFLLSIPGDPNADSARNPPFEKHWTSHCIE